MTEDAPAPAAFDYAAIDPAVAAECRARAAEIRRAAGEAAGCLLRMGGELYRVKHLLYGAFSGWVALEFAFGRATAYKMIDVYKAFRDRDLSLFEPTAAYVLAEPRVPREAREVAFMVAGRGDRVTAALAREIAAAHRLPGPTAREVRAIGRAGPDDRDPDDPGPNLVRDHRAVLAALKSLVQGSEMIVIQRVTDTDAADEKVKAAAPARGVHGKGREEESSLAVPLMMTVYRRDRKPEAFVSAESFEVMVLLAGTADRPILFRCQGPCGQEKELLVHFGKKANKGSGRCVRCKRCEADRVRGSKDRKRKMIERRRQQPRIGDGEAVTGPAAGGAAGSTPAAAPTLRA